jgi:RimJ/RimL family protein N-acetyltransferase
MSPGRGDEKYAAGYRSGLAAAENGFDHGYRRLEWKCDSMNVASRRAADRWALPGRASRQRLVRKGRTRDSDMLSIDR